MPRKTLIDKMEEAITPIPASFAQEPQAPAEMPYKKGEFLKPGEEAKFWTGPRPWKKSTEGSPPFTDAELKQGYRKLRK